MQFLPLVVLAAGFIDHTTAFPTLQRGVDTSHYYMLPSWSDSRGPCPGLNTLANHGYLNRDGRNIDANSIFTGFFEAFGMNQSAVAPALPNSLHACSYVTGTNCSATGTLSNLTVIAEPHAAEHDHSISRQDYKMAYNHGKPTDNYNFNPTIFQQVLDLIGQRTHVDFQLANEIRLLRTSNALKDDEKGWLQSETESKPLQAIEIALIFAVMADPTLSDAATNPQIRVDWWHHWFAYEQLPYSLGWKKPNPPREVDFILSVSAAVFATTPTSTPFPLPADALGTAAFPTELPETASIPILPLPTEKPYVGIWPLQGR